MNTKIVSRLLSGFLSLALLSQLGAANAYAAYPMEETMDETQSVAAAGQSAWDQLKAELSKNGNPVSQYVNEFDKKEKTIIWVKGITPPTIGAADSELQPFTETVNNMVYETYRTPYIPNRGWYDINKIGKGDTYLCFGVAASNSLHWWLEQNDKYVQQYIAQNPDTPQMQNLKRYLNSFHDQENSDIFEYFKGTFGGRPNGYWPDLLQDYFLNGYPYKKDETVNVPGSDTPVPGDDRGFFYDVFGSQLLSHRHKALNYEHDSDLIKQLLMDGEIVMPTFVVGQNSHVVTLWGAEYDLDGRISAIFLSDSDDGDVTQTNQAMKRYTVKRAPNGKAVISTHASEAGNELYLLNSLSLGEQYWKDYSASKQTLTLQWGDDTFDYDRKPHKSEVVSFSGHAPGDDVKIVTTGEKTDAGTFAATAEIQGADAGKYKIKTEERMHSFTIRPATAAITVTANLDAYATDGTVKLRADVKGVDGEKPEGTITFFEGGQEIGTTWTDSNGEYTWRNPSPGSHQIIAKFKPNAYGFSKNYVISQSAPTSIDILDSSKQEQAPLVFAPITGLRFGDADFTLNATGGSTQSEIQYVSSDPNVILVNGSTASIKGVGTTNLTATKPGDATYNSVSKTISVQVAKGDAPAITYPTASSLTYGQSLGESQLIGGSETFGSFAWENPSMVPGAGSMQYRVTFTPNPATEQNYEQITPLSQEVSVSVSQAASRVILNAEVKQNGAAPVVLLTAAVEQAGKGEAPSDGTVMFMDCTGDTPVAIPGAETVQLQNGVATFTWTGMQEGLYSIRAQFSGSANYTEGDSPVKQVDTTAPVQETYPIHVESDGNGTARASHTSASQGTEVTLTAEPNAGFQFKEWKVLAGEVTLSGNTFVMPDMPVSIQAVFEKQDDPSGGGDSGSGGSGSGGSGGSSSGSGGSSSGSGGSSSGGSNSSTKPDSPKTETVKQPDGTVIEETKKADGSHVIKVTTKDGITSVSEVDRGGKADIKVVIPEKVSVQANQQGQTIVLPMPPAAVQNGERKGATIRVDLGNAHQVKVSVPVEKVGSGFVAVAVDPDGTKQVIRKSMVTEDGVVLTLDGSKTLQIEDRSKVFEDVKGHWAKDAIDFVSSREIFNGTTATTFSPNSSITRGMLVKSLHNLEGMPHPAGKAQFSDVSSDAWFADAIEWAVESGIVKGINDNQFAPEKQITREQVAVMLYRYAGSPAPQGDTLRFTDVEQMNPYAHDAICWAVENGIITGTNIGALDPQGTATRAQTAAMMMRFMKTIMQ